MWSSWLFYASSTGINILEVFGSIGEWLGGPIHIPLLWLIELGVCLPLQERQALFGLFAPALWRQFHTFGHLRMSITRSCWPSRGDNGTNERP